MLKFIAVFLFTLSAFAENSMLDLRMAVDPFDAKNRSHVDILSQAALTTPYGSFLINPQIDFYLNKSVDFGISLGHRWKFDNINFGNHVFFDRSQLPHISVNQIGAGFDLITPKIDFRGNYYHPISPSVQLKDRIVKPCKWIESEVIFKNKFFNIGAGPNFNLDSKVAGAQGKFIVPFERFSVGIGGSVDGLGNRNAFIITSFNLYRNKYGDGRDSPIHHTKRPRIEYVPSPSNRNKKQNQHPKQEEQKKPQEPKQEEKKSTDSNENEEGQEKFLEEYWKSRNERERNENSQEILAPPEIPPPENAKTLWESIKNFFLWAPAKKTG